MIEIKTPIVPKPVHGEEPADPKWRTNPLLAKLSQQGVSDQMHGIANNGAEAIYLEIVRVAKELYAKLPDDYSRTYIERCHRNDLHDTSLMERFMTSTFLCELILRDDLKYTVHLRFYYCPFRKEIEELIQYPLANDPYRFLILNSIRSHEQEFNKLLFSVPKRSIYTLEYKESEVT